MEKALKRASPSGSKRSAKKVDVALRLLEDPVFFGEQVFGISCWARQAEILRACVTYPRVAVRSGHKVGKSTSAALLALWYASVYAGARVILTSASARQVKEILWREVKRLYQKANPSLDGVCHEEPSSGLRLPNGSEVLGFSTDKPERMAGISGEHLLFIVDEASGVEEAIFEAIEGNRAGGARLVLFSNPTRTSGTFYEAFTSKQEFWHRIHVSSEETPNCTGEGSSIPGLATKEWVNEKRDEWGEDSPLYQVRVKGNFPSAGASQVMPLHLVEAAQARWTETPDSGPLEAGLDPARFGDDDAVLSLRRGLKAYPLVVWQRQNSIQLASLVLLELERQKRNDPRVVLRVDTIGVGSGVFDQLRALAPPWLTVLAVQVSERATAKEYHRLRDQVWYACKEWLEGGGALPPDPKLEAELVAPSFTFDAQGKIQVSSKDEIKDKLRRSPDRADALCLSVAQVGVNAEESLRSLVDARAAHRVNPSNTRKRGDWSTY